MTDLAKLVAMGAPLFAVTRTPSVDGSGSKHPISKGYHDRAVERRGAEFRLVAVPSRNIGLTLCATWGPFERSVVVLDVEAHGRDLVEQLGIPSTIVAESGRGGIHAYLDIDPNDTRLWPSSQQTLRVRAPDGTIHDVGQIKCRRQFVLVPPSVTLLRDAQGRVTEHPYRWISPPWSTTPATAFPDWVVFPTRSAAAPRVADTAHDRPARPLFRLARFCHWVESSSWGEELTDDVDELARRVGVHQVQLLRAVHPGNRNDPLFRICVVALHAGAANPSTILGLIHRYSDHPGGLVDTLASRDPEILNRTLAAAGREVYDDWTTARRFTFDRDARVVECAPAAAVRERVRLSGTYDDGISPITITVGGRTQPAPVTLDVTRRLDSTTVAVGELRQLRLAVTNGADDNIDASPIARAGDSILALVDQRTGFLRRALPTDPTIRDRMFAAYAAWLADQPDDDEDEPGEGAAAGDHVLHRRRPADDEDTDDEDIDP